MRHGIHWRHAVAATLTAAAMGSSGCDGDDTNADCVVELDQAKMAAYAGAVQTNGSVTVYGTIQFADADAGAELAVRAVYVAGQEAIPGANDFNFRAWTASVPQDVLAAYAGATGRAALPVVAYLYGGCLARLSDGAEPVVAVFLPDGGAEAGSDGGSPH